MTLAHPTNIQNIILPQIRIDGGTQPRVALNEEYVAELAQTVSEGDTLPPVVIYSDGSAYWLADGFHRYHALERKGWETIPAEIRQGTRRDAVLYSVGANAHHGLRRTNADKRRAVETLLNDSEWMRWSNREIARQCGVSLDLVNTLKHALSERNVQIEHAHERLVRRNGTIYTMNSTNIGRFQPQEQTPTLHAYSASDSLFLPPYQEQEMRHPFLASQNPPSEVQEPYGISSPLSQPQIYHGKEKENDFLESDGDENDEEIEASEEDHSLEAGGLDFTTDARNDLRREAVDQEKERRDAHVLRILGSSESPEWYTPQEIVQLTCELLGEIDLDPCSNSHHAPAVPARVLYTKEEDGLALPWKGKTYLNPPYGSEIPHWVQKLVQSYEVGEVDEAVALLPGRIDTLWFQPLYAYPICHIRGRLQFANSPYHAPFPCVIIYLGTRDNAFIEVFKSKGPILRRVG